MRDGNPHFQAVDGVLFDFNISQLVQNPAAESDKQYTIPDTVNVPLRYPSLHSVDCPTHNMSSSFLTFFTPTFNSNRTNIKL